MRATLRAMHAPDLCAVATDEFDVIGDVISARPNGTSEPVALLLQLTILRKRDGRALLLLSSGRVATRPSTHVQILFALVETSHE